MLVDRNQKYTQPVAWKIGRTGGFELGFCLVDLAGFPDPTLPFMPWGNLLLFCGLERAKIFSPSFFSGQDLVLLPAHLFFLPMGTPCGAAGRLSLPSFPPVSSKQNSSRPLIQG